MSLAEPIVEGAYYLHKSGGIIGPLTRNRGTLHYFRGDTADLVCQVWPVHTDPAEVVAELRRQADRSHTHSVDYALNNAADLVAEKLGVQS